MKKTLFGNSEMGNNYLYAGVEDVYGEFVLETGGDPVTLNDLEEGAADTDCKALIETIRSVIADPDTCWEPCSKEDERYISDWLDIWGIAQN